jgi:hypothetical protein
MLRDAQWQNRHLAQCGSLAPFCGARSALEAAKLRIQSTKEVFGLQCVKIPG